MATTNVSGREAVISALIHNREALHALIRAFYKRNKLTIPTTLNEYPSVRASLLESELFQETDGGMVISKETEDLLVRLSEIARGDLRKDRYGPELEVIRTSAKGTAADIGSGAGWFTEVLARNGYVPVHAYDLVPAALEAAAMLVRNAGSSAIVHSGDATSLPGIADGELQLLFSRSASHYFHQRSLAETIKRKMAPGGYLIFETIGLGFYLRWKSYSIKRPQKCAAYALVVLRSLLYELTGQQLKLGGNTPEIGHTPASLRRFARMAGLVIVNLRKSQTYPGYVVIMQRQS